MEIDSRHQCLIYQGSPSQHLTPLAAAIQRKLKEGYRCMYLNSRPMVAGMRSSLAALGVDVVDEVAKGRLILSSEIVTAPEEEFDTESMLLRLEGALDLALAEGYKGLWATGDMTWEFGAKKNFEKLMDYEFRLEELFHKRPELQGICQYHHDTLPHGATRQAVLTHKTFFINETLTRMNPHFSPSSTLGGTRATVAELDATISQLCQLRNLE